MTAKSKIFNIFISILATAISGCEGGLKTQEKSNFRTASASVDSASSSKSPVASQSPLVDASVSITPGPESSASALPWENGQIQPSSSPSSQNANQNIPSNDSVPPVPGQNGVVTITNVSSSSLELNWIRATDNLSTPSNLSYQVFRSGTNNLNTVASIEEQGTALNEFTKSINSFTVTSLALSTTYFFNIIVKDQNGNKATYAGSSQTTLADVTAPVPGNQGAITSANVSSTSMTINWTKATDDVANDSQVFYLLYLSTTNQVSNVADIESFATAIDSFSSSSYTKNLTNLVPGTTYYFNVIAKDNVGNKVTYQPLSIATSPDATAPLPGSSGAVTLSAHTVSSITLNWTTATDNTAPANLIQYEVRRSLSNNISSVATAESNGTIISVYLPNSSSRTITGLIVGSDYYFTVIAKDPAGNKSAYNTVHYAPFYKKVSTAGMGGAHTCVISHDATLRCFGENSKGQLGYDDTISRGQTAGSISTLVAVNLGAARTAKKVSANNDSTCVILDNGSLKCWGNNSSGILGQDDTNDRGKATGSNSVENLQPIFLGAGRTATEVTIGYYHACAILDNGALKCWGNNYSGQLGYDDTVSRGDTGGANGMANLPQVFLGTNRTAKTISSGYNSTCALLDDSSLKCWGYNYALGTDDSNSRGDSSGAHSMNNLPPINFGSGRTVKFATSSYWTGCAILDNNQLKCWGDGTYGELGNDSNLTAGLGSNFFMPTLPAVNLGAGRYATSVSLGNFNACATLDDGTVKCWGSNWNSSGYDDIMTRGDGIGAASMVHVPTVNLGAGRTALYTSIGTGTTCALLDNDTVKCWGSNYHGELGQEHAHTIGASPLTMGDIPPINLGSGKFALDGSTSGSNTCAILKTDGSLKCWGYNYYGSLGYDDLQDRGMSTGAYGMANLPTVNIGNGHTLKAVSTGGHTCAILDDDTVKCWGYNNTGQLGLDDQTNRGHMSGANGMSNLATVYLGASRTAKKIDTGNEATCAILDNDNLKCWGKNTYGTLGLGDTTHRGYNGTNTMTTLPAVSLGAGRTALDVSVSGPTCVLLDNFTVKCWGSNVYGQLGLDDTTTRGNSGGASTVANLPAINLGVNRTAKAISSGGTHVCAILDTNAVKCWGYNNIGQLGLDDAENRGEQSGVYSMANLPTVNLGTGRTAKAIAAGLGHTCAILDTNAMKCWGNTMNGLLGQDSVVPYGSSTGFPSMTNLPVINLGAGRTAKKMVVRGSTSCAILDDDTMKCWGTGYGQDSSVAYGSGWPMSMALPVLLP